MFEKSYGRFDYYAASDECGRGPLAGPVLACSVGISNQYLDEYNSAFGNMGISDSKKLSSGKINKIIHQLEIPTKLPNKFNRKKKITSNKFENLDIALYANSNIFIDHNNILVASLDAMKNSFIEITQHKYIDANVLWLIDGPFAPKLNAKKYVQAEPVIKGDSKSILIGLASVIAKYYRDYLMQQLDLAFPGYGLAQHKGYPTASHLNAIRQLGPSEIHRRTFKGVIV